VDDFDGAKGQSRPNSVRRSRAPLEAPSAAIAWCAGRSGSCSVRPRDPKRHVNFCWNLRSTAWCNAEHDIQRHDSDSDDIDTSSDEEEDFLLQKQDALRVYFFFFFAKSFGFIGYS
jgi:hypothetical protein